MIVLLRIIVLLKKFVDQVLLYLINFVLIAYDCAVLIIFVFHCVNVEDVETFRNNIRDVEFYIISFLFLTNIYEPETLDVAGNNE